MNKIVIYIILAITLTGLGCSDKDKPKQSVNTKTFPLTIDDKYKFRPVVDNFYVLIAPLDTPSTLTTGLNSNIVLIVGTTSLIVIDSGSSYKTGRKIIELIKHISNKPVSTLINSSIHGSHWLGNKAFVEAYPEIKIYANQAMVDRLNHKDTMWFNAMQNTLSKEEFLGTEAVHPSHIIIYDKVIDIDSESLQFFNDFTKGNTNIAINHVDTGVLFLGEITSVFRLGYMDISVNTTDMIRALKQFKKYNYRLYLSSHGMEGNGKVIIGHYINYLTKLKQMVSQAYADDLLPYEVRASIIKSLHAYNNWFGFDDNINQNINKVFMEVELEDLSQ